MNLYKISQDVNNDYDSYDSAVVAAESVENAKVIKPDGSHWGRSYSSWCTSPDQVSVVLIGTATKGTPAGVILASFNAG